ncbi:class 1 fructose-bisphosphatase [Novosphingobium sp.]|uniref:class 1 fructose-bisphosphatase n=1 Tax=Novosphingobium sp. TaxID=1874826 RepID=UPI00333FABAB
MTERGLDAHLARHAASGARHAHEVAATIALLAQTGITIARTIAEGAFGGALADKVGATNSDGDSQRGLDLLTDELFLAAAANSPVGLYASEELADPVLIGVDRPLALAIDPLDGSSNIDTNVPIGTIFSIRPIIGDPVADPLGSFLGPGHDQIAAGYLIYGPQTALVITLGAGTHVFVYSPARDGFHCVMPGVAISPKTREFAINASNHRHWDEGIRLYFDDCIKGGHGPREGEFNMRWIASLVAEAHRILVRGGVFLYPGDRRRGYAQGRLRLVYEAHPIAMLVVQAGGTATDCTQPILDIAAKELHQRTPLVFGSANEVARIGRYNALPGEMADRAPLFGKRGLFRA